MSSPWCQGVLLLFDQACSDWLTLDWRRSGSTACFCLICLFGFLSHPSTYLQTPMYVSKHKLISASSPKTLFFLTSNLVKCNGTSLERNLKIVMVDDGWWMIQTRVSNTWGQKLTLEKKNASLAIFFYHELVFIFLLRHPCKIVSGTVRVMLSESDARSCHFYQYKGWWGETYLGFLVLILTMTFLNSDYSQLIALICSKFNKLF